MKFSTITSLFLANAGFSLAAPTKTLAQATAIEVKTGDNGIETPLPIQPGMVDNCDRFHFVAKNTGCLQIANMYGITFEQFKEWNPTVGSDCRTLWADANVCVRTIGYKYPVSVACYGSKDIIPWGSNKAAALTAARDWCYNGGGGGIYEIYETKTGCVNAPSGAGKFVFEVKTTHGTRIGLTGGRCQTFLNLGINGCKDGAQTNTEGWTMETTFETGKCKA
ncbi:hypothetical protein NXS19_002823 [Fusarium pseudograminearum]|uniref:LysM domain-containing protein n=1 Tax=Fusarium pseudograminearum (strain CS3096) TaxID=1028729 RepID=K3W3L0_FUSPC|nr:hypothetical protein FPSE_00270 [Fusarium pseudograminearum CS3096]EKJ79585.1 hypothetical protein FPSE_00270 [Fusarium pseudograminearum CS3096]KAF0645779.1 hypothetical protein FPSE5266_00270 [Fusarium pseudograminearum]UZP35007.1 hypothetical protein NXS19_002823 [Fusarium pseudograminearum]